MMGIRIRAILGVAFSVLAAGWIPAAHAKTPGRVHPLDPLTGPEISTVVAVLRSAGRITPDTRFAQIYLKEPEKTQVLADIPAGRPRRAGFALLYNWAAGVVERSSGRP